MSPAMVAERLRQFLLSAAGLICLGTPIELWLTEHTESPPQWIPFVLCGLGLLAIVAVLARPQRAALLALRGVMVLLVVGSLFGVFEHVEHNVEFEREIRPNATMNEVWVAALRGANPLLAPGILALSGMLALGATYQHPALAKHPGAPLAQ